MKNDFVLTQVREVVMTADKTVTTNTEKLETIDSFGHKKVMTSSRSTTEYHKTESVISETDIGRAA